MNYLEEIEKVVNCMNAMVEICQQCNQGLEGMITDSDLIESFIDCKKTIKNNSPEEREMNTLKKYFVMGAVRVCQRIGDIACCYIVSNNIEDEDLKGLSELACNSKGKCFNYVTELIVDMLSQNRKMLGDFIMNEAINNKLKKAIEGGALGEPAQQ